MSLMSYEFFTEKMSEILRYRVLHNFMMHLIMFASHTANIFQKTKMFNGVKQLIN